jgi:hypothetical protein
MIENVQLERSFFNAHADTLHELFVMLGREQEWCDTPEELLPYTQQTWVGYEHGNSAEKDQFSPDQEAAALAVMPRLGLREETRPPTGSYEQVVILAGMMRVNRERAGFTRQLLDVHDIEAERIICLTGKRARDPRDEAQLQVMDLEALATDEWVRDELTKPSGPVWNSGFAAETDLARLAYLESFPRAGLIKSDATAYTFAALGYPDFTLMDCPAVERPTGSTRPTVDSSATEWLNTEAPSENASVLVVAGNPHIPRNDRDIRRVAARQEREDIVFTVCGPAANPEATIQLYLGEIGRLFYMDVQEAAIADAS